MKHEMTREERREFVSQQCKQRRQEQGLSREAFCLKHGLAQGTVARIERLNSGREYSKYGFTERTLKKIALAYGYPVEEFTKNMSTLTTRKYRKRKTTRSYGAAVAAKLPYDTEALDKLAARVFRLEAIVERPVRKGVFRWLRK